MNPLGNILGFGASSMEGCKDSQGGFLKRMERALNRESRQFNFVNLGIGGDTTRQMLARIDAVATHKPDCTIVLLGCNDMPRPGDTNPAHRTSLDEYAQNLQRIFPKLRSQRSIFVTSFYVKWIAEDVFAQYMATAKQLATGYELWDLYEESRPLLPGFLADDFAHFNDAGHQYIAEHLLKMLAGFTSQSRKKL